MKAAVLISGYLRTIKSNFTCIQSKILDSFDKCDVYLHITHNEKSEDKYFNPLSEKDVDDIKNFLAPKALIEESNIKISNEKDENNVLNLWTKYRKLYDIVKENERVEGEYDVIIKYRPDVSLLSEIPYNLALIDADCVFLPEDSKIDTCKLRSLDDAYVCDTFAFGSSKVMGSYFPTADDVIVTTRDCGTVPETFLHHHLSKKKIEYRKLEIQYSVLLSSCNVFAIAGDSGSGKSTLASILKESFSNSFLLECDRYHKWERGDGMWKKMTHLNPESNYLSKMRKDIFDLKLGNEVYHVNYDHKTGKFTEQERIPSSDNLIVCGLHSLYVENDRVYNCSIFMDTDDVLRKKWKIKRDTRVRGYEIDRVLSQISSREEDYKKYVNPQKEKADVIVNFYTDEDFSIENLESPDRVGLRILVSEENRADEAILKLNEIAPGRFKVFEENLRKVIQFPICSQKEYDSSKMLELYTYVVLTILNMRKLEV